MNPPNSIPSASPVTHRAIFQRDAAPHNRITERGTPPPWRDFASKHRIHDLGANYRPGDDEIRLVNAALFLRRPLLVTGKPGTGKSTLAQAIKYQLNLDPVLEWPITSRATLQQGLYQYDAVARLQDAALPKSKGKSAGKSAEAPDIGKYIRLGALGTALLKSTEEKPCILLIDEIDKSDIDLPNDLLHIFEKGNFEIPELSRLPDNPEYKKINVFLHEGTGTAAITRGVVKCSGFPIVILTSNGERDFPPAFLRRCLRLDILPPTPAELKKIVEQRLGIKLGDKDATTVDTLVEIFHELRKTKEMATDQLLNAVYAVTRGLVPLDAAELAKTILRPLSS